MIRTTLSRTRVLAGLGAVALVGSTALVAAPAAQAYGPASASLDCRVYIGDTGDGFGQNVYTDTFTLTQTVNGANTDVTLTAANGPNNGPVALPAGGITIEVSAVAADSTAVALTSTSPYPAAAVPGNGSLGGYTATGSYAGEPQTLTVNRIRFNDSGSFNADIYCSGTGDGTNTSPRVTSTNTTIVDVPEETEIPAGAVGGVGLAAVAALGLGFALVRSRRRRTSSSSMLA